MQVREFDPRSLDKLKPCPFCGGDAELDCNQDYRAINGHFGTRVAVYCTKCSADQGTCLEDVPDLHPNEVIKRWNKRTTDPLAASRLSEMEEERGRLREALKPFAKAHAAIEEYDPAFPDRGAALRASFDFYVLDPQEGDTIEDVMKRRSVTRGDLRAAAKALGPSDA